MKRLAKIDNAIFNWIAVHPRIQPNRKIPKFFTQVSKTGDGYLYAIVVGLIFLHDEINGRVFLLNAAIAFAFEIPLYLFLKKSIRRPRPCDTFNNFTSIIQPSDKFSLPSGHTAAAFLMATICAYFYPSLSVFGYLWAGLIGVSRIVLKVHFVLDVIVGALFGISVAVFSLFYLGHL